MKTVLNPGGFGEAMKMCRVPYRPRKEPGTTYYCILPPGHEGQHRGVFGVVFGPKSNQPPAKSSGQETP